VIQQGRVIATCDDGSMRRRSEHRDCLASNLATRHCRQTPANKKAPAKTGADW
jgi:hypothetical protein